MLSSTTAFSPSSERWSHLLVKLDFSSSLLTVYVDGVQDVQKVGLTSVSIASGSVHLSSTKDTGITISGLTIFSRALTADEIESLGAMCNPYSEDALLSMADLVRNRVDGLLLVIPSTCDPYNECATSSCGTHTCVNGVGTFTCVCSGGWTGTRCDIPPDYCLNHDCKRGTCVPGSGTYFCKCTDFYTGSDCSIPPVNGGWSPWSDWTSCDVTCGGGKQTRLRFCVEPEPGPGGLDCQGSGSELNLCNSVDCPVCKNLNRSYGTILDCAIDPESGDKRCNVSCSAGLTFPSGQEPYPHYTCGRSTGYEWIPFAKAPACMEIVSANQLEFRTSAVFENPAPQSGPYRQAVSEKLNNVTCVAENTCTVNVSLSYTTENRKRSIKSKITISFSIQLSDLNQLNIAGYMQNGTVSNDLQRIKDAFFALQEAYTYLQNHSTTIFDMIISGVRYQADPASVLNFIVTHCHPGFSGKNGFCVECPAGTYEINAVCRSCDVGTYQFSTGKTTCEPCPNGFTTSAYMASSIAECVVPTNHQQDIRNELEHEESNTAAIVAPVVVSVVVIGSIVAVVWYKKSRPHSQNGREMSFVSINMVHPKVLLVENEQQKTDLICSSPPPYEGI